MSSDDQFQGLVKYLITCINQMLKADNLIIPIALVVNSDKSIKVVKANVDSSSIVEHVDVIQNELKTKAENVKYCLVVLPIPITKTIKSLLF